MKLFTSVAALHSGQLNRTRNYIYDDKGTYEIPELRATSRVGCVLKNAGGA